MVKGPNLHFKSLAFALITSFNACAWSAPSVGASSPSESSAPKPTKLIRIGCITSLTGVGKEAGQEVLNGIKLYLEQIHDKMAGVPVELIIENDGSSSDTAKDKFQKLVETDHVDVIHGLLTSRTAHDVAPLGDHFRIPGSIAYRCR